MARLPVASQDALRGDRISSAQVQASDMGLGALGRAVSAFDQNEERLARERALRTVREAEAEYGTVAAQREAEWDRTTPGLASSAGQDFDLVATKYRAALADDDRAQRHFDELSGSVRTQSLSRAGEIEARGLGELVRSQTEAARQASVMRKMSEAGTRWTERRVADVTGQSGADVTAPGYRDTLLSEFDAETKAEVEAAPEYMRPALMQGRERLRADLLNDVTREQISQGEIRIKAEVTQSLSALENRVIVDPNSYRTVLAEGMTVINALPPSARAAVAAKWPSQLQSRMADQYVDRGDVFGLEQFLSDPKLKAQAVMDSDQFARYRGWVETAKTGAVMQSRQAELEGRLSNLQAEYVAAFEAGTPPGDGAARLPSQQDFIKAYGFQQGPVRYQAARDAVVDLKAAGEVARSARTMGPGDFARYADSLKPQSGDPNFARKDKQYRMALEMGQKIQTARLKDPAAVVASDPQAQAAYQTFLGGEPGAARQWATLAVERQKGWGLGADEIRVLPEALAAREVAAIKAAPPEALGERLTGLAMRLSAYGPNGRYAFRDLQRAGLDAPTAALVQYAGANPRVMSAWAETKLVDSLKLSKLDKATKTTAEKKVLEAFAPFEKSFGAVADHKMFAAQVRDVAVSMATARMANGESADEAVRAVRKLLIDDKYTIDDRAGWRLPRDVAGKVYEADALGREGLSALVKAPWTAKSGKDVIRAGAQHEMTRLLLGVGGVRLRASGTDKRLSEDQRRQREAEYVKERGRWVNTADDRGLILMAPNAANVMAFVLDDKGQPITRTFEQLAQSGLEAERARNKD